MMCHVVKVRVDSRIVALYDSSNRAKHRTCHDKEVEVMSLKEFMQVHVA